MERRYSGLALVLALNAGFALGAAGAVKHWWQYPIVAAIVLAFVRQFGKETR